MKRCVLQCILMVLFVGATSGLAQALSAPGDPHGELFRVCPEAGLLLVFPSWLYHWGSPLGWRNTRIAVLFNAASEVRYAAKTSTGEVTVTVETEAGSASRSLRNGRGVAVTVKDLRTQRVVPMQLRRSLA